MTAVLPPPTEKFVDKETGLVNEIWYRYLSEFLTQTNSFAASGSMPSVLPVPVAEGGTGQITEAEALGEMTQALTEDTSPDKTADFFVTYDASADTGKKVAYKNVSPWTTVMKTVNETLGNSTTFQDDDALTFAVAASTKYAFRLTLIYNTPTAADLKIQFTGPGSPTYVSISWRDFYLAQNGSTTAFSSAQTLLFAGTTDLIAEFTGIVHNGTNAGSVTLQWAKNSADAGTTTVYAGSFLEWMTVA